MTSNPQFALNSVLSAPTYVFVVLKLSYTECRWRTLRGCYLPGRVVWSAVCRPVDCLCLLGTRSTYRECRMLPQELFAKLLDANITQPTFFRISIGYRCAAESTTRLPSFIKPWNCNNLRVLLVYSRHIDSRAFWGHLNQTCFQHNLHRHTWLLVDSHAATPPFGTVFLDLYALLTVSLVLGLSSRLTCSQDICSLSTVCASNTLMSVFCAL